MIRNPVESSNLISIGYENGILEVEFYKDSIYRYYNIPMETYIGLMQAESKGSYLHQHVKTKGYEYEQIEASKVITPSTQPVPVVNTEATALFNAIKNGKLDVINVLLRNNPKWVTTKDKEGRSPLHYAVEVGNVAIVKQLIKQKADVNARDSRGVSPLHWAIDNDQTEIAKCLIEYGADVNVRAGAGI